jgi:hypothetical protein
MILNQKIYGRRNDFLELRQHIDAVIWAAVDKIKEGKRIHRLLSMLIVDRLGCHSK